MSPPIVVCNCTKTYSEQTHKRNGQDADGAVITVICQSSGENRDQLNERRYLETRSLFAIQALCRLLVHSSSQ